jgi:hypothetical protein
MYQLWTLNCAETEVAAVRRKAEIVKERILNFIYMYIESKSFFFGVLLIRLRNMR